MVQLKSVSTWVTAIYRRMLTCQVCWINVGKKQTHIFFFFDGDSRAAAKRVGIAQLVYVSVAQPAPIMRAYLAVRAAGERMIKGWSYRDGIAPVVRARSGPPVAVVVGPLYKIAELVPATRESAKRLGLVTIEQMLGALVAAVENPPRNGRVQIVVVTGIRSAGR